MAKRKILINEVQNNKKPKTATQEEAQKQNDDSVESDEESLSEDEEEDEDDDCDSAGSEEDDSDADNDDDDENDDDDDGEGDGEGEGSADDGEDEGGDDADEGEDGEDDDASDGDENVGNSKSKSNNDKKKNPAKSGGKAKDSDLAASDTESDEDLDDEDKSSGVAGSNKEPKVEMVLNKYRELKGKQLFIRFPKKLPEDDTLLHEKVKALSRSVVEIHRPRQKSSRHCLIDFKTKEDRDAAMKAIRKAIKVDENFKGIIIALPKTEKDNFVNELAEKAQKSLENKRAKARLKRQKKKAMTSKVFTSAVVIANLSKITTVTQLREVFPNAIDINIKPVKALSVATTMATVNLPSTMDASKAVKQKIQLNGTELAIKFSKDIRKKKNIDKKKKNFEKKVKDKNGFVYDQPFKKALK